MSKKEFILSATIVLYKENIETLKKTINCFLKIPLRKRLYLVDNSPNDNLKSISDSLEVEYIFINKNIGFAAANNRIIDKIRDNSEYHLILNPDVFFDEGIVEKLIDQIKIETTTSMIAPRVIYMDGNHQYSVRKYPTFLDLVIRKLGLFQKRIQEQEYRDVDLFKPFNPDVIHGCFQLYKTTDFVSLNGFDERYFLYMEDVDICKKIDALGKKKLYYPEVTITHVLKQGSSKNLKLFFYHLTSAIKYFLKWR